MSILSKLRLVTVDVTGTLIAYKGELGDYYCMAAKSIGLPCPDYKRVHEGFKQAYTEMATKHPCFGFAEKIPNIVWWKTCVRDSFLRVRESIDSDVDKVVSSTFSFYMACLSYVAHATGWI